MDLSIPEKRVLVGDWTSISYTRQLMLTLKKLGLSNNTWGTLPMTHEGARANYRWLTPNRLVWEDRRKLKMKIRDKEDMWMLYER